MQKQVWKTFNLSAVKPFAQDTWWKWRRYRLALLNALDFFFLIRGLQLALVTPFSTISGLWHFDTCICRPAVLGFFTIWWIFGCSCFQWGVQLACSLMNFLQKNCTLHIRFLHCGLWSFFFIFLLLFLVSSLPFMFHYGYHCRSRSWQCRLDVMQNIFDVKMFLLRCFLK